MLQIWGFLAEFYPESSGDWEKDSVVMPEPKTDNTYGIGSYDHEMVADLLSRVKNNPSKYGTVSET